MTPRKGEGDERPEEPVAPQPATTSGGKGKIAVQIELDRADAERLLQDLMGEFFVDKQRLDEVVKKHWAASEKGTIVGTGDLASKHKPPSR